MPSWIKIVVYVFVLLLDLFGQTVRDPEKRSTIFAIAINVVAAWAIFVD